MRRPKPAHVRPMKSLYRRHRGKLVFVLGNSASLNELNLELLKPHATIGVNRILRTFTPTYLFVVDRSVIRDEHKRMTASKCEKVIFRLAMNEQSRLLYPGPYTEMEQMSNAGKPTTEKGPIHICRGGNSGYEACHLAFRMGAACIALAGMDMYWPKKGKSHFFGHGRAAGCSLHDPAAKIEDFRYMKHLYRKQGVEMVSVSPWRTYFRNVMEHISLEKLLQIYA